MYNNFIDELNKKKDYSKLSNRVLAYTLQTAVIPNKNMRDDKIETGQKALIEMYNRKVGKFPLVKAPIKFGELLLPIDELVNHAYDTLREHDPDMYLPGCPTNSY